MIYELRTYQLAFGGLPEYLEVAKTMRRLWPEPSPSSYKILFSPTEFSALQ